MRRLLILNHNGGVKYKYFSMMIIDNMSIEIADMVEELSTEIKRVIMNNIVYVYKL